MTSGSIMENGEGERLYAAKRKRFWKLIGGLMLAGAIGGFASGFAMGYDEADGSANAELLRSVGAVGCVIAAIFAAYGSWRFFENVDELEVADNLWGSLIGFYTYALMLPTWWMLHRLERAPEVNHWVIYAVSFATAAGSYAYRKWRLR